MVSYSNMASFIGLWCYGKVGNQINAFRGVTGVALLMKWAIRYLRPEREVGEAAKPMKGHILAFPYYL